MPEPGRPSPESETRLLQTARERGILSPEQVEEALRTRQTLGDAAIARAIEEVLLEKGVFTPEQVRAYRQLASETVPISDATRVAGWERTTPTTSGGGLAAAQPDLTPGEPFGRYRLVEALGHGGMGVVWKAWDTDLRRVVALKQILGDAGHGHTIERFLREARAAARLRHPGIVSVYDVGVIDGKHYLTADFVEGTSLDKRLREGISTRDAVAIVKQVAEALQYAHDQGIVHRDIKPGNILLDRSGTPHVADFGLAKDASLGSGPALTLSGDLLGTPSYMSPEQARGRPDEQGPASDQFSLGVMLYEVTTGRLPFGGMSLQDILNAITDGEPVAPTRLQRKLHADVETVILKMLEKDPSKRYPSMRDLAADLGRILEAEPIEARRPGLASRLMRRAAKHKRASVTALLATVVCAGLVWIAWTKHTEGKEQGTALQKTERVQSVLVRWGGLTEAVRQLQENDWDETLTPEQRTERNRLAWEEIAQFMSQTPDDATSQATMKALAGWARVVEGDVQQGMAWLAESRRLDPEVPFGALLEGLLLLTEYCKEVPVPRPRFSGMMAEEAPSESARQIDLRARIVAMSKEAAHARVRAGELSTGLEATLQSLDAVRSGDFPKAERTLANALGSGAMQWCRIPLFLWRALIRRRLGAFQGAFDDLAQIERACPRWHGIPYLRGLVFIEQGLAAYDSAQDPSESCRQAVQQLTLALESPSRKEEVLVARAGAHALLAEWGAAHGSDPCPAYELALRDFSAAAELAPAKIVHREGAAVLRLALGLWRSAHGEDPGPDLEAAVTDLDFVIEGSPGNADRLWQRGSAHQLLARIASDRGRDPRENMRRAVADLRSCQALVSPPKAAAQCELALTLFLLGTAEAEIGADPRGEWREARAEAEAAAALAPNDLRPWAILATLRWQAGELQEALEACKRLAAASPGVDASEASVEHLAELLARDRDGRRAGWRRIAWLAEDLMSMGEFARGRLLAENAIASAPTDAELDAEGRATLGRLSFHLARVYARLSQPAGKRHAAPFDVGEERRARHRTEAIAKIERALELGWDETWELEANADLDPLRGDSRWKGLLDSLPRK